jgi:hypothetical protein
VGFEPTIPVLERAKTVRVLDRAATAMGGLVNLFYFLFLLFLLFVYSFDVGLESPFCQFQAIHILSFL